MSYKKGRKGTKGRKSGPTSQPPPQDSNAFNMDALSEELSVTSAGPDSGRVDSRTSQSSSHRNSPSRIPLYLKNGLQPHHSPLHSAKTPSKKNAVSDFHSVGTSRLVPDVIMRQQQQHNLKNHMSPGKSQCRPLGSQTSATVTPSSSRRTSSGIPDTHRHQVPFDVQNGLRYEDYMPLCQLQKALKKGQVLEVSTIVSSLIMYLSFLLLNRGSCGLTRKTMRTRTSVLR